MPKWKWFLILLLGAPVVLVVLMGAIGVLLLAGEAAFCRDGWRRVCGVLVLLGYWVAIAAALTWCVP